MLKAIAHHRLFGLALWVAIVVQALLVAWSMRPWEGGDTPAYLDLANGLAHGFYGTTLSDGPMPDVLRPPGYPLLLWFLLHVWGLPAAGVVLLQVGIYLLTIFLIDRWLARKGVNLIAFRVLAASYPFAAAYSAQILTEAWAMLTFTLVVLLVADERFDVRRLTAAGVIAGIAALIRTDLLLIPIFIGGLIVWRAMKDKHGLKWAVPRTAAVFLASATILLPYSLWNLSNFGILTPAPLATAFGHSLSSAYWQEKLRPNDFYAFMKGTVTRGAVESGWVADVRRANISIGAPPLTSPDNPIRYPTNETRVRSSAALGRAVMQRIESDPGTYIKHVVKNTWLLWNSSRYPGLPKLAQAILIFISYFVFFAGMLGVVLTLARPKSWPVQPAAALLFLYPWLVHLPMHLEARYTAAARPLLLMFASLAVMWVVNRLTVRRVDSSHREQRG